MAALAISFSHVTMKVMFKTAPDNFFTLLLFPFLGGLLYAAGFPSKLIPASLFWGVAGITLFYASLKLDIYTTTLKRSLVKTFFFSLGYTLLGYYWIPQTISIFGELPLWAATILGILFTFISLLQWPIALLLFFALKHFLLPKRLYNSPLLINSLFILLLILSEHFAPQQFPTHLGHQLMHLAPYLFLAPYIGEIGYSWLSYQFVLLLHYDLQQKKAPLKATILFGLVAIPSAFFPLKYAQRGDSLHIRMVQANIGSLLKVGAERGAVSSFVTVIKRYRQLSLRPTSEPLDLIIWPETAYPETLYSNLLTNIRLTPPVIREVVSTLQAPLLMGGYDLTARGQLSGEYNTAFLFTPSGKLAQLYHKMKLIPFGEGLPFGPLNPFLKKIITNISYFSAGKEYSEFKLKSFHFITPICYEILFPRFIRHYLNQLATPPAFLLNLTNDSWYGDTSEPYQHQFLAKWRALEFGIPLVRMTNTGISSIIYPDGQEAKQLGVYQAGILDQELFLHSPHPTFFQHYGIYPLLILQLLLLLLLGRKNAHNTNSPYS